MELTTCSGADEIIAVLTLSNIGKIAALDLVVSLHEDLTETRLSDGVIFQVKLVESVEGILVGLLLEFITTKSHHQNHTYTDI